MSFDQVCSSDQDNDKPEGVHGIVSWYQGMIRPGIGEKMNARVE